jgi:acetylornithine deacetylase/succinyl-diaminopimelate desuccinylase-like protein
VIKSVEDYIKKNEDRYVDELISWLKIPSISTLSEHADDVRDAGNWARKKLENIGFPVVEFIEGDGHPLVYAEWLGHADQPTLLIYGHYDVQPVDPLEEWHNSPFEPVIENGNIYARGATDDKGQVMVVLAALEAWVNADGSLPINVKMLLEGEEEAGGEFVAQYVPDHAEKLHADAAFICDTHMNSIEQPSLINGLRGILYTEIAVSGPKSDLHSGGYGGVAPNPIHALCLLIARLKGEDGRINVPGIYDSPVDITAEERSFWTENQDSMERRLLDEMGVDTLVGENDILPHERLGVRPTLEIHGIKGGFTGEGAKTVIPAEAVAKVSLRLPAGMKSAQVFSQFENAVKEHMPNGYKVNVINLHGGEGVSVSPDNSFIQAASASIESTYGNKPVFMREGGSIPIAALFDDVLKVPVVLMGFGLPGDGAHGPNEKFSLAQFKRGIVTVADYLGRLQQ